MKPGIPSWSEARSAKIWGNQCFRLVRVAVWGCAIVLSDDTLAGRRVCDVDRKGSRAGVFVGRIGVGRDSQEEDRP